jgi:hypothetical protein
LGLTKNLIELLIRHHTLARVNDFGKYVIQVISLRIDADGYSAAQINSALMRMPVPE